MITDMMPTCEPFSGH